MFAPYVAASLARERIARWRDLTLEANLAVEREDEVRARQLFEEALAVAEELFTAATSDPEAARAAPLLHGSSCRSIVELARRQRDEQTAGIFLYRGVNRLIAATESQRDPLELRSRCLLHLQVASRGMYEYFEQHGMWDAAAAFSERANSAMFAVADIEAAAVAVGAAAEAW